MVNYNIRSLPGKIDDARIIIQNSAADCFLITESWMHDMLPDTEIAVSGYNMCRLDRDLTLPNAKTSGGGGGD